MEGTVSQATLVDGLERRSDATDGGLSSNAVPITFSMHTPAFGLSLGQLGALEAAWMRKNIHILTYTMLNPTQSKRNGDIQHSGFSRPL